MAYTSIYKKVGALGIHKKAGIPLNPLKWFKGSKKVPSPVPSTSIFSPTGTRSTSPGIINKAVQGTKLYIEKNPLKAAAGAAGAGAGAGVAGTLGAQGLFGGDSDASKKDRQGAPKGSKQGPNTPPATGKDSNWLTLILNWIMRAFNSKSQFIYKQQGFHSNIKADQYLVLLVVRLKAAGKYK